MKAAVTLLLCALMLSCLSRTLVLGQLQPYPWNNPTLINGEEIQHRFDALETRTQALQNDVSALKTENSALKKDVSTLKNDLSALKNSVGPKVAFSASLTDGKNVFLGPGASHTIVFKYVIFNNANAYNCLTGYFTAPQKGAYLFTFSTFGFRNYYSGAQLMKNGQVQATTYQYKGEGGSTSQAVILSVNAGDLVYVITRGSTYQVYDDMGHLTIFSGVLLFPL